MSRTGAASGTNAYNIIHLPQKLWRMRATLRAANGHSTWSVVEPWRKVRGAMVNQRAMYACARKLCQDRPGRTETCKPRFNGATDFEQLVLECCRSRTNAHLGKTRRRVRAERCA